MTESLKPAGWYHAAGDPPGSHRYWNGSQWQGEPRVFGGSSVTQRNPQAVQAPEYLAAPQTVQAPRYDSTPNAGYAAPEAGYAAPEAGYAAPDAGYAAPDAGYAAAQVREPDAGYRAAEVQAQASSQGLYRDATTQPAISYAEPHVEFQGDARPGDHTDPGGYVADQAPSAFSMQEMPGQPVATGTGTQRSGTQRAGSSFFSSLFDLSFTTSITKQAISVIYLLVMVVIGLVTLAAVGTALTRGIAGLVSLLFIIPAALFYLVMTRLTLEFLVNQFQQTELMERITDSLGESGSESDD